MPDPPPPFRPGQRVRCVVSTADRPAGFGSVELRGRVGVVVRATWLPLEERPPGVWDVLVQYDLVSPNLPRHHAPEELVAVAN